LDRVLSKLIANAICHTPERGSISILATRHNKTIPIFVEDTGEGIPPADLPHIFDRFYRSSADGASSGLRLAIAKALVEAHGGRIWASSVEGNGTRFEIELPVK
jgi:two-component system OmpR family sensor kinase